MYMGLGLYNDAYMDWAQGGLLPACRRVQELDILVFGFIAMVTIL